MTNDILTNHRYQSTSSCHSTPSTQSVTVNSQPQHYCKCQQIMHITTH